MNVAVESYVPYDPYDTPQTPGHQLMGDVKNVAVSFVIQERLGEILEKPPTSPSPYSATPEDALGETLMNK